MKMPCARFVGLLVLLLVAVVCHAGIDAWTTTGPRGGVTLLATDAAAPGRVFASTRATVYRSLDNGATWHMTGLARPAQQITVRGDAPEVVYAAVGTNYLWKSSDGGATWVELGGRFGRGVPFGAPVVTRLHAPAQRPRDLYALDLDTLYYSADDGASWSVINMPGIGSRPAFDATRPGTIYVPFSGGFAKTFDNGTTWWGASEAYPVAPFGRVSLVIDAVDVDRLYLFSIASPDFAVASLHASADGGNSWSLRGSFPVSAGSSVAIFEVDPSDRNRMRALVQGWLYGSDDGGVSWRKIATSADEHVYAFALGTGRDASWAAGSVNGLQYSGAADAPWEPRVAGLPGEDIHALAVGGSPRLTYLAAGATTYRRDDASSRWADVTVAYPDLGPLPDVWAHPESGVAYALQYGRTLRRSADRGASWETSRPIPPPPGSFYGYSSCTHVVGARQDDRVLVVTGPAGYGYAGSFFWGCAAMSVDGGATWRDLDLPIGTALGNAEHSYCAAAIDPARTATLWVAPCASRSGDIYRSDDAGATWRIGAHPGGAAATSPVTQILVDPSAPRRMVVTTADGHAWRSEDEGTSWSLAADSALDVRTMAVDWNAPVPILYAGTGSGVYRGTGVATLALIPGSRALSVNALELLRPGAAPERSTLVAATTTGVYEFTADPAGAFVPVYRFFNAATGTHFYTALEAERSYVLARLPTFHDEGTAFWALAAAQPGTTPVYRFYNTGNGTHFYTASGYERDYVRANLPGYVFEGPVYHAFGADEPASVPAHRFYNPDAGAHFYTADNDEWLYVRQHLPRFVYEGATYSVYPAVPAH